MKAVGLALAFFVAATTMAKADVLLLDSIKASPPNNASGLPRPSRGSSMATVRSQFGEPSEDKTAIGDPPITRWIYPAYTVYFEYQHVIDVVVHR
jgi:hypothetical protein